MVKGSLWLRATATARPQPIGSPRPSLGSNKRARPQGETKDQPSSPGLRRLRRFGCWPAAGFGYWTVGVTLAEGSGLGADSRSQIRPEGLPDGDRVMEEGEDGGQATRPVKEVAVNRSGARLAGLKFDSVWSPVTARVLLLQAALQPTFPCRRAPVACSSAFAVQGCSAAR
jgi:hypothetical protein